MRPLTSQAKARRLRAGSTVAVVLAASAAAVVVATAAASAFTLRVAKNVHVTNQPTKMFRAKAVNKREAVAVGPSGFAVYTFQGEFVHGATRHLICQTAACLKFWPPVTPSSSMNLSKPSAIKGKLGTFHHHGMLQLTLNGQPLYYFTPDIMSGNRHMATGDWLKTFGSIWHIVPVHVSGAAGASGSSSGSSSSGSGGSSSGW